MKGIHCALQGRLGNDVELRRSASEKDWCRLSVGVGEGDEVTWVPVAVFEEKARALVGLAKGAEVYVEGRPIPEYLARQGRSTAHGAVGLGVARGGAGADRKAEAQGTITR